MFENQKILKWMRFLTFASIVVLVFFTFVSVSITALSHIFIFLPGIYFLAKAIQEKNYCLSKSGSALFALIIIGIVSIILNPMPLTKIFGLKYYFLGGILAPFAYADNFKYFFSKKKTKILTNSVFLMAAFASLVGIYALYTGFNPIKWKPAAHLFRASGLYGMYMTYGYGIGFLLICSFGLLIYWKRVKEFLGVKWHLLTFVINFLGLILSATRGALLGFVVAIPLLFFQKGKKWVVGTYLIGTIFLSALTFGTSFGQKLFFERTYSNAQRMSHFQAAYYAVKESPYFGLGFRNFESNSVRIKKEYNIEWSNIGGHAHNNFLEQMASTGFFGLIALLCFLFFWAKEMAARKDLVGLVSIAFIAYFIGSGMVQYTFGDGENVFFIMFIYALGQSLPRLEFEKGEDNYGK